MASITGGLGGLGLLASREIAASGQECIQCISRSGRHYGDQFSALLVDHIQEIAMHQIVKGDTSDASVVYDFFNQASLSNHYGGMPTEDNQRYIETERRMEMQNEKLEKLDEKLRAVDAFGLLSMVVEQLQKVVAEGYLTELRMKMPQLLEFKKKISGALSEAESKFTSRSMSKEADEYIHKFRTKLSEFNKLLDNADRSMNKQAARRSGERESAEESAFVDGTTSVGGLDEDITARWRDSNAREVSKDELLNAFGKQLAETDEAEEDISQRWRVAPEEPPVLPPVLPKLATCPEGHQLLPCAESAPWTCKSCKQESDSADMQRFTCSVCQYDLCGECSQKHKSFGETITESVNVLKRQAQEADAKAAKAAERRAKIEAELKAKKDAREEAQREAKRQAQKQQKRESKESKRAAKQDKAECQPEVAVQAEERKQDERVNCPLGHELNLKKVSAGYPCDICDKDAANGESFWGCSHSSCNYDVCGRCRGELLKKRQVQ